MIKHIVFWNFKEQAEGCSRQENILKLKAMLEALDLPQIVSLEVGVNINTSEAAFDAALYSEFASREDLQTYLTHPDHLKISAFCKAVRSERKVVDYEVGLS